MADPLRILLVDDSRLFRSAMQDLLSTLPDVVVVGSVFNGTKAIDFLERNPGVDLVLLDVEMPEMDGIATLACINRLNGERPMNKPVGVIMVSAFTKAGAEVTVRALQYGAFDFIPKPGGPSEEENLRILKGELIQKLRAFIQQRMKKPGLKIEWTAPVARAPQAGRKLRAIVIGASTGGPKALATMLPALLKITTVPVLLVQHMPQQFTLSLADTLSRQTGKKVVEAREGEVLSAGSILVGPGGKHLMIRKAGSDEITSLSDAAPENGCKPSVDVLFRSAAQTYGPDVLAIILTGMGNDGTAGAQAIRAAGGYVIAQDESTSVVWGMPGSAVQAGAVDQVVPLANIAGAVDLYKLRTK
jgi:two-component system, chemotaxis family, protein-glutamate methylesterase/glutaminase